MPLIFYTAFFMCLIFHYSFSQVIFQSPLSKRNANYVITARLDTEKKVVYASETLRWKNISKHPVRELQFHLYLNAFRNLKSTFLSKLRQRHRGLSRLDSTKLGGIDIDRFVVDGRYDLTSMIEFIQPDDENICDSTVIKVPLPMIVLPSKEITIEIGFCSRLPRIIARTGYVYDFFLLGQWFPKIGVLEDGKWNCHQFHINSEFFSDFGVYEVNITLPVEYIVGSSGILIGMEEGDSLKTMHFLAEDVHDFAVTAWPKFNKRTVIIEGVDVDLLYAPEHAGQTDRYIEAISATMKYLGNWLGPYPYPNLTIVDVPVFAGGASGMEYPCFITAISLWGMPSSVRLFPEEVTIHEYIHQYFYGMIASNEAEEPWLDEGFTSYATNKVMVYMFGSHSSFSTLFNIHRGQFDSHKNSYMRRPALDFVLKPSWEFSRGEYGLTQYDKPVLILQTLENLLGEKIMNKILVTYFNRWQFKHPKSEDFFAVVNEIAPQNMDWFFQKSLKTNEVIDYSVLSISNEIINGKEYQPNIYTSKVLVKREGTFQIPVEISFSFEDGDTLMRKWNGDETERMYTFQHTSPLIVAQIDPKHKICLDLNWTNNSKTVSPIKGAFYRHWLNCLEVCQQTLVNILTF
jgi:hypothetical protein